MKAVALQLKNRGWRLRSGLAQGADQAFMKGAGKDADLYIPFPSFQNQIITHARKVALTKLSYAHQSKLYVEMKKCLLYSLDRQHLKNILRNKLYKALHGRNVLQVLGENSIKWVPSKFVILWARQLGPTQVTGGTNTVYQIARYHKIPTFNMWQLDQNWSALKEFLAKYAGT